jgi:hypothetical protein
LLWFLHKNYTFPNILKPEIHLNNINSVPTSKKTPCISITNTNKLILIWISGSGFRMESEEVYLQSKCKCHKQLSTLHSSLHHAFAPKIWNIIISYIILSSVMKQSFTSLDVSIGITVSFEVVSFPENIYNMNRRVLK